MARRLAQPEFRVWYTRHKEQKWAAIRASSVQEAQRLAKKKYGDRLLSVKPIEKAFADSAHLQALQRGSNPGDLSD